MTEENSIILDFTGKKKNTHFIKISLVPGYALTRIGDVKEEIPIAVFIIHFNKT